MLVVIDTAAGRQEVVAVADRLDDEEERIERNRRCCREGELGRGELGAGRARREGREDEAERGERRDGAERRRRPLGVEGRSPLAEGAEENRHPDDPVAGDHHRREDRVARERVGVLAIGHHQRHDQADLDDGHGDREHERAERLADAMGDHFRVMNCRKDCAAEQHADAEQHRRAEIAAPGDDEQHKREHGHDGAPAGANLLANGLHGR